jgi:DNA primase
MMGFLQLERCASVDVGAIRRDNPLPEVVGAMAKVTRRGGEWQACCPLHDDRSPSFTIYAGGQKWWCFGCGVGGDVIDFMSLLHGVSFLDAINLLGSNPAPVAPVYRAPAPVEPDRSAEALAIWEAASPVEGTPAETYLRWRGITIEPPISLRYAPLRYGSSGPLQPCLIACVSSAEGPLQGIQRIYLAADGLGKADVPKSKLSLGRVSGGDLVVVEGLEDGLTVQQELGRPVWVVCGASMLPALRFPDTVGKVAIGGDNDDAGRAAADKAARAFSERGLMVRTFYPPPGSKDFNELLQERAALPERARLQPLALARYVSAERRASRAGANAFRNVRASLAPAAGDS